MIDSFAAAAESAQEALRDPGGLRFAHVPSLVAFVSGLRTDGDDPPWDARELAQGVRLNRLLWELGLRDEAHRLFDVLAVCIERAPVDAPHALELRNCLAVVAMALGLRNEARRILKSVTLAGREISVITWINRAAVDLALGDIASATMTSWFARRQLHELEAEHSAELDEMLAAVELRLASVSSYPPVTGERADTGDAPFVRKPVRRPPAPDSRLSELARHATAFVREVGDNDPRAFLSVAGVALARGTAALRAQDTKTLTMSVHVLEVACQRLSAMLGADHPQVLGVLADLAAVQVESARVTRSAARLERAVAQLASVSERLDARLGPGHPRSVAALANLVTAQVESVRATGEAEKADRAERTAEVLAEQARRAGERLGEQHPVTRLVRASSRTCRRIAARGDDLWDGGSTMLMTLTEAPRGWVTDARAYRSFDEAVEQLSRDEGPEDGYPGLIAIGNMVINNMVVYADAGPADLTPGEIVLGTVVAVRLGEALLSLVRGGTGVVPFHELSLRPEADAHLLEVGQRVEAMALGRRNAEGNPVLSVRRARAEPAWDRLQFAVGMDGDVTGTVIDTVRGGLVIDVGVRAFLPADLVDRRRGADPRHLLGTELETKITDLDRRRGLVMLSRRAWLEDKDLARHTAGHTRAPAAVLPGRVFPARVTEVSEEGAFVDGGVLDGPGLIPREELSWRHVDDPSDVVRVGERILVRVLGRDADGGRGTLSLRAVRNHPWRAFTVFHRLGEIIEATVTKVLPDGAVVRVEEGIDGLVRHYVPADGGESEPDGVLIPGERIFVAVTDIDYDRRRLSFSLGEADAVAVAGGEPSPVRYGMAAYCDSAGQLILPDGYDEEDGTWLPGFQEQREHWEGMVREVTQRCTRHREWVARRRRRISGD
ncbi:S1 RNA-binding domain-containing protein [Streptomyces sp. 15-116A]|uniref:S1 RNA-binding domain-containing protein n=1 Tax=Streptomyces sp. 15-116A TaxID=2259035 RepID=UPI0021B409DE|nr:S1 RNA-binding domain-containing protein [Streptomyces sp. 15-116A]MCT7354544.1 S1 RNA-binding domain-containing protein [Streptomyces sp. 15-116A]